MLLLSYFQEFQQERKEKKNSFPITNLFENQSFFKNAQEFNFVNLIILHRRTSICLRLLKTIFLNTSCTCTLNIFYPPNNARPKGMFAKKPFCKKREKTVGGVDMCRPCFCLIYFVVFRFPRCDMNIVKM